MESGEVQQCEDLLIQVFALQPFCHSNTTLSQLLQQQEDNNLVSPITGNREVHLNNTHLNALKMIKCYINIQLDGN